MKSSIIFFTTLAFCNFVCHSQTEETDTTDVRNLTEVVIEASKVIHKPDRDIFFPNKEAVANSQNGMQLIRNLMIPSVMVNDIMGSIKSSGETVQVRINGREATIAQVSELLPETIRKVEYIDNPGLRYNGASAVLNIIVSNPTVGGSLMLQAMPALNCAWGEDYGSLKLNRGRSQFGVNAYYKLTNKVNVHREYSEKFTYEDRNSLTRTETPVGGYLTDTNGSLSFDYSYIKPDTTVIWVGLSGFKRWDDGKLYEGILKLSNGQSDIRLRDENHQNSFTPNLSAYWEQHFRKDQLLVVNVNASLYSGSSSHRYVEQGFDDAQILTDVGTEIKENNKAIGVEANYIKRFRSSNLTFGGSYSAYRNKGEYSSPSNYFYRQNRDEVYFFGEYLQNIGKVTITGGLGVSYLHYAIKDTEDGNDSWNFRPQFSISYRINRHHRLRASLRSWQTAPSLSETSIVPQQIDGFQWRVGNPNLKNSTSYRLALRYYLDYSRWQCNISVRGYTSPNAIAQTMQWNDGKLITSYENSRGLKTLSFSVSPQVEIIPGWLICSGNIQYKIERMKGNSYKHYNRNWSGDISAMAQHWGFSLLAQYSKAQKSLYGEIISWGESMSLLSLSYRWRWFEFTGGVYCPFTKYDQGSRSLNRYNTNSSRIRLDMSPMPFVQIQYNLQWGRDKRGVKRLIDNNVNAESSSVGSR